MDPITIVMFALIAVLVIFMFRNGKKRQKAMQELQDGLRPGAEVMLQSGIYGTVESVDAEENRVTVHSGTSSIVVHRNAIGQIIAPAESVAEPVTEVAPDDDPAFGERVAEDAAAQAEAVEVAPVSEVPADETPASEIPADEPASSADGDVKPSGDKA